MIENGPTTHIPGLIEGQGSRLRIIAVVAMTLLVAMGLFATPAQARDKAANTDTVCHIRGNGTISVLMVNPAAVAAHVGHGDPLPADPVAGSDTEIYGDDCVPIPIPISDCPTCLPVNAACVTDTNCCSGNCVDIGVLICAAA